MQFLLAACSIVPVFIMGDWHWANFPMASHNRTLTSTSTLTLTLTLTLNLIKSKPNPIP